MSLGVQTMFSGRLVRDPEPLGQSGVKFTVAVDDYDFGEKSKVTRWVPCAAFGKTATNFVQYAAKGRSLTVRAKWTEREVNGRKFQNFVVEDYQFNDSGKQDGSQAASTPDTDDPWG